jgi:7-carboxy-7-deazaguanine synthase
MKLIDVRMKTWLAGKAAAIGPEAPTGFVSEIFCSLQGEGLFVGERQIFVRTAGCSATCSWCDTVHSKQRTPQCVVHGGGKRTYPNPMSLKGVVGEVLLTSKENEGTRAVSVTGGEPLEQPEFVTALAERLKALGFTVHLETNGLHADAFQSVLPFVDVVAMDIKLPSAIGVEAWGSHADFLSRVRGTAFDREANPAAKPLFVKVVVDSRSTREEVERAVGLIATVSPKTPLVLQPESASFLFGRPDRGDVRTLFGFLHECRVRASAILEDVRVIPQCHKILHVR